MSYEENARRIGKLLEERIPLLRKDTAGKDFRPGGGAEKIVGGVMARWPQPDWNLFPGPAPVDVNGPIDFKVIFGGEKPWADAVEVMAHYGIAVTVRVPHVETVICDGEECKTQVSTWAINFTLPQDWEFPCTTSSQA